MNRTTLPARAIVRIIVLSVMYVVVENLSHVRGIVITHARLVIGLDRAIIPAITRVTARVIGTTRVLPLL